jgi:hypothetical protein
MDGEALRLHGVERENGWSKGNSADSRGYHSADPKGQMEEMGTREDHRGLVRCPATPAKDMGGRG